MVRRGKRAEDSPETAFERLGTAVHVFSPGAAVTAEKRTLEGRRLHGNVSFGGVESARAGRGAAPAAARWGSFYLHVRSTRLLRALSVCHSVRRGQDLHGRGAGSQASRHETDDQRGGRADVEGEDSLVDVVADRYPTCEQGQQEARDPEADFLVTRRKLDGARVVEAEKSQQLYGGASHEAPEEYFQR